MNRSARSNKRCSDMLYQKNVIYVETDLTDGERAIIAEGDKLLKERPEDFTTLEVFITELDLSPKEIAENAKKIRIVNGV